MNDTQELENLRSKSFFSGLSLEEKQRLNELKAKEVLTPTKPQEEENGDVEFIMSSSGIDAAIRAQQPKQAYLAKWFEQTLSSDYVGTGQERRHIIFVKQVDESDKAVKVKIAIQDAFGRIIRTEDKWFPKKAIINLELL